MRSGGMMVFMTVSSVHAPLAAAPVVLAHVLARELAVAVLRQLRHEVDRARPLEVRQPATAEAAVDRPPVETDEPLPDYLTFANDESAPATAAEEIAEGPTGTGEGTSRVSDLEREMARLLGEITSKRGG